MRGSVLGVAAMLATAAVCSAAPAAAPVVPDQQLSVTVYSTNLALVQDIRHLEIPNGRTRLEFKDVSATIRPETVALSGKGLSVVEQNFDYDLLTPAKMMEKAVGSQIQIIRTNPATGAQVPQTATVLSVNDGVVLKVGNHIEVLRDDGIPTRVVFSSIPENLRAQPTLSVTVDAAGAGARDVTLSYLTTGLGWRADYVALYDEKLKTIGVDGWVTLNNRSGTSFRNAATRLIAGDVNLSDNGSDPWQMELRRRAAMSNGGSGASTQATIGDYDVFTLPGRVTIAANQTKQVSFLDLHGVRTDKSYAYHAAAFETLQQPAHAEVALAFNNGDKPLPAGIMRVYMRDVSGNPTFMGEDNVGQTPPGSDLGIKIGEAFDVTVQPLVEKSEKIDDTRTRYAMSYTVRNAKAEPVVVDIRQSGLSRDAKVEGESLPSKRADAQTLLWSVPVPANGTTVLSFTVDAGH